jgi:alkylation response protein AidB-like acyl-CoA dehydrogenase
VLSGLEDDAQQARHLPGLASGEVRGTLAFAETSSMGSWRDMTAQASREGGAFLLNGEKAYVLDGHSASWLIVALLLDGAPALFAVPGDAEGLERRALRTMDATRRQASVHLRNVRLGGDALLASGSAAERALAHGLDLAAIALAAEQVGGAQHCLDMALDHARTRQQFGRPIGSFQAIKHMCADMLTQLETARSACYYAAAVAASGETALGALASLTKVCCSEAYFFCASQCIQIHGGIGFTWEHDAQLHFKRARSSMTLLGDPAFHRERIAVGLLD